MRNSTLFRALTAGLVVAFASGMSWAQSDMKPPIAKKVPKILKIHGYEIVDNYAWMRDRGTPKSAEVVDHLNAENAYTDSVMGPHKGLTDAIYEEMLGRIKQDDTSVPYRLGGYWYFTKTEEGKQYPKYLRSRTREGRDAELLLDQNEMAKGFEYFALAALSVSEDGNLLAYATDTTGYRQYTLQIKDLRTGKLLADRFERVTSLEWSNDGKYLFIAQEDAVSKRSDKVFRHKVGTDETELVYEEKDLLFNVGVGKSRDNRMIFISSFAKTSTEFSFLRADDPLGKFAVIAPRRDGHEYDVDHRDGEFYIRTNAGAENFKVMRAAVGAHAEKEWRQFVGHDAAVKVESVDLFKEFAVLSELENGLEYLRIVDLKTKRASFRVDTPESVYTMGMSANPEFDTDAIRYVYSSMITPNSTFEFDVKTGKTVLLKQQVIPSGYDKSKYETARVWVTARDGVKVPVSLVMKRGTRLDGQAPMLLYAYGSYGYSTFPNFSSNRFSLVDRGMIFGIAHVRGGSELGEKWRIEGRMFKKLNTFHDFIDCGKWLIENKYTSADRLVVQGGSAGGLLMGGVVNMSPETFKAAIVQVPFVDVMNTMLDETLPLTTEEWDEWGNPNEKKAWDYMVRYSPYDNVKAQKYPNMLVEVSLNDSQVPYWEGAKFVAKVRELKTDDNVVLLKANMGAGHGGASGRFDRLREVAFEYTYALVQVGITK